VMLTHDCSSLSGGGSEEDQDRSAHDDSDEHEDEHVECTRKDSACNSGWFEIGVWSRRWIGEPTHQNGRDHPANRRSRGVRDEIIDIRQAVGANAPKPPVPCVTSMRRDTPNPASTVMPSERLYR
jgi:hypothetical protein